MTIQALFTVVPAVIGIIVLAGLIIVLRGTWRVAPPNQALIIAGMGGGRDGRTFKIVVGGGSIVLPGLQTASYLSLNLREAALNVSCVTQQGIPVVIQGVCIYKVADDPASITNAARRFLGQDKTMDGNIQNLFDGHLRSIVGTLTVEQLIRDRVALTDATRAAAKDEIAALGLQIDSLQIKDIGDPTQYIENLAKPHIATVQQAARVAQAAAQQAASIAEQEALANIAEATSQSSIKQAQYAANTAEAQAKSAQAGPLAEAIARQAVIEAATKQAELEADRVAQELESTVRRPADAEAYRVQTIAGGARAATIAAAEAAAQQVKLEAAARAEATTVTGTADGAATSARGTAEAAIVKAKALAEADGIAARAGALAEHSDAVIAQKIAELMPQIVAEAARPFASIKDFIVLDGATGVNNSLVGVVASALTLLPIIKKSLGSNGTGQT